MRISKVNLTDFSRLREVVSALVGSIQERSRQRLLELESGQTIEKKDNILTKSIITSAGMFELLEDGTLVRFLVHVPQGPSTWETEGIPYEELLKDPTHWHKFHIFKCKTVSDWAKNMRKSSRNDGKMIYLLKGQRTGFGEYRPEERKMGRTLKLCKFCRNQLPIRFKIKFDLFEFMQTGPFKKDLSEISDFSFEDEIPNSYSPEWSYIATKVKELRRWTCELCKTFHGADSTTKKFLQVHHKDRRRYNNNLTNLEALCLNCHAKYHPENQKLKKRANDLVKLKEANPEKFEHP